MIKRPATADEKLIAKLIPKIYSSPLTPRKFDIKKIEFIYIDTDSETDDTIKARPK